MTIDNRYYDALGNAWWDPYGPMGLLLRMNRVRYGYFRGVLEDFKTAIAESSRVLKPGGILLYETVNRTLFSRISTIWALEYVLRKIPRHSHDWRMFIRPDKLVVALEACGLRNQEFQGLALKGGVPGFLLRSVTGQDPWVFEIGSDTRVGYLGYAIKPA